MKMRFHGQHGAFALCLTAGLLSAPSIVSATLVQPTPPQEDYVSGIPASEISRRLWPAWESLRQGRFQQVKAISESVLEIAQSNIEALSLLAAAEKGLGNDRASAKIAAKIERLAPSSHMLPLALAWVYRYKNDTAGAEKTYLTGITKAADKAELRMQLADFYLEQQRFSEAEEQYREVLTQSGLSLKHTLNANFALCRIDLRKQAYDAVIDRAKWLIKFYPPIPQGYQFLAAAYLEKGETKQAAAAYEDLMKANPQSPVPYQELALIALEKMKDPKQAMRYAEKGAGRFPADAKSQDVLGWVYYRQGAMAQAAESFLAATRLAPDNARLFYHLGMAQEKLGNQAKAQAAYRRALGLIEPGRSRDLAEEVRQRIQATKDH